MSIAESFAPTEQRVPASPEALADANLLTSLEAERAATIRQEALAPVEKWVSNLNPQKEIDYLSTLIPQFDGNLGFPSDRLAMQPLLKADVVNVQPFGTVKGNVKFTPKQGVDKSLLTEIYEADPSLNKYRRTMNGLIDAFKDPEVTSAYGSESFSMYDEAGQPADRDLLLSVLSQGQLDFLDKSFPVDSEIDPAQDQVRQLDAKLAALSLRNDNGTANNGEGIYVDANGRVTKVLMRADKPGMYIGIKPATVDNGEDILSQSLKVGLEYDAVAANVEKANGMAEVYAAPFLQSETAQQMLSAFEASGLVLSDHTRKVFTEANSEKRYGQAYAELTRELAKVVDMPGKSVADLFVGDKPEIFSALAAISGEEMGYAAALAVDLMKQLAQREQTGTQPYPSDIPVTKEDIKIKEGACKDAEAYYFDARTRSTTKLHDKQFLTKSDGKKTYINIEPIVFNGITIQPGGLFSKRQADEGFALLRLTMYAVGDEAQDACGVQYAEATKSYSDQSSYKQIQRIITPTSY